MERLFPLAVLAVMVLAVHADEKERKPPKRAEEPFVIFVDASPKGEKGVVADILEAREELEKKLRKNKKWFRVSGTAQEAEVVVDLQAYWVREERRTHDQRHVAGASSHTIQVDTIYEHHSLRSITTVFGAPREMTGAQVKRGSGSAKGAAGDLAKQLERYFKEHYWELEERRKARSR